MVPGISTQNCIGKIAFWVTQKVGRKMYFCQQTVTFVIAFPLFTSNVRGLQPQASHCEVSWMVARIWPRDIFFEKDLKIQVEYPTNVKNSKNLES